jgi:hypothetical protein
MHAAMRSKFVAMPLMRLRKLHSELAGLIRDLEASPRREVDVAYDHRGLPGQTCQVLEVKHITPGRKRRQLEKVYCSERRRGRCPHGPYWYEYRSNARGETVAVTFKGAPAFDYNFLQELKRNTSLGKPYVLQRTERD